MRGEASCTSCRCRGEGLESRPAGPCGWLAVRPRAHHGVSLVPFYPPCHGQKRSVSFLPALGLGHAGTQPTGPPWPEPGPRPPPSCPVRRRPSPRGHHCPRSHCFGTRRGRRRLRRQNESGSRGGVCREYSGTRRAWAPTPALPWSSRVASGEGLTPPGPSALGAKSAHRPTPLSCGCREDRGGGRVALLRVAPLTGPPGSQLSPRADAHSVAQRGKDRERGETGREGEDAARR